MRKRSGRARLSLGRSGRGGRPVVVELTSESATTKTWSVIDEQGFTTMTFADDGAAPVSVALAAAERAAAQRTARLKARDA